MLNVLKDMVYRVTARRDCRNAIEKLGKFEARLPSARSRFALPFLFQAKRGFYRSMRPRQNSQEIERLFIEICDLQPQRILEIGTAKGGTLYLWAQAAADDATIISIDLPGGQFGGGYPTQRIAFYQAFARLNQELHLLREDSHDTATLEQVRTLVGGELDFAFIDGDHTYDGVKQDFEMYGSLVRPGGIIAFHDILPQPQSPQTQVYKLWNELRESHDSTEIVAEDEKRLIGIGFIRVSGKGVKESRINALTQASLNVNG